MKLPKLKVYQLERGSKNRQLKVLRLLLGGVAVTLPLINYFSSSNQAEVHEVSESDMLEQEGKTLLENTNTNHSN